MNNLSEYPSGLRLWHSAILDKVIKDLAANGVLCDQVDHLISLHDLVEPDDVRMSQPFHYVHLAEDFREVLLVEFGLVDDFDRHLKQQRFLFRHTTLTSRAR